MKAKKRRDEDWSIWVFATIILLLFGIFFIILTGETMKILIDVLKATASICLRIS